MLVIKTIKHHIKGKGGKDFLFPEARLPVAAAYVKTVLGKGAQLKDLRTVFGTSYARDRVAQAKKPTTAAAKKRLMNDITDEVAAVLGNTRKVAFDSYIHPAVFDV